MTKSGGGERITWLVFAVLFVSGASALVYEISWSRQFGLLLGHTSQTASIVLATYFCGMAIGYAIAARIAASLQNPLKAYAIAEILAAVFACLIPPAMGFLMSMQVSPTFATIAASTLLLLPTSALGATLPFVAEHFSRGDSKLSPSLTTAYAWNTAGAVFGVVLATFVLIQYVGVAGSSFVAALVAALVGAITWIAAARYPTVEATRDLQEESPESTSPKQSYTLVLMLVAVSGAATLGLQVLYTHMFSLVLHNSTYTFGTIIGVFLIALAVSSSFSRVLMAWLQPMTIVAWACGIGAALVAVSPGFFLSLTELKYYKAGNNLLEHITALGWLTTQVVGLPVLMIGLVLPTLWFALRGSSNAGRTVGTITAVNTVAAVLGALCMSHVALPLFGVWAVFTMVAVILLVAACVSFWASGRRLETLGVALLLLPVILQSHQGGVLAVPEGGELVKRWETNYGWVDLIRRKFDGVMLLRQNIHYGLGSNLDAQWEKRQGHLPIVLHGDPRKVCFLGLGTGLSSASAVEHPQLESIVAVELIPEVVDASKMYPETKAFHEDPRVTVAVGDASHFLIGSESEFDVVIGDLFTPFHSHTGYLYTVEHFQHVRKSLKEDGIFCQWLAMWQIGKDDFEMIADSFAAVFPNTTLWWGRLEYGQSMVALVGTEEPLRVDVQSLAQRLGLLQQTSQHPDPFLATPERIRHLYAGEWKVQHPDRLNTDERPRVEFSSPQSYTASFQLRGDRLSDYWIESFEELSVPDPFIGVSSNEQTSWPTQQDFKQWQRRTLTRKVKRGRGQVPPPTFLK